VGEIPSLTQQPQATVTVISAPAPSGGKGGGGGATGVFEIATLVAVLGVRRRLRRYDVQTVARQGAHPGG